MKPRKLGGDLRVPMVGELRPVTATTTTKKLVPLELGRVEFEGSATTPGVMPAAGQTTHAYLEGKTFQRKSHEVLGAEFKALLGAWPKDTAPGVTPQAFTALAAALDTYKGSLWANLSVAPNVDVVRQLVADLNVLHGKPGHTENVIATTLALLADPQVYAQLGLQEPKHRRETASLLTKAATWLNLCDAEIPTGILCAPRRLTDEETAQYVKPRAERSAAILEGLSLEGPEVVRLVRQHRGGPDRPPVAQLLDLADQVAAMAAKPFFQKDGQVDAEKLSTSLRANAERSGLNPAVVDAVCAAIQAGAADAAKKKAREQDLWVR